MTKRNEYFLRLSEFHPAVTHPYQTKIEIRPVQITDGPLLAELMIEAYRGTIDYDGETYDDALAEVNAFFAGERGGPPWLETSYIAIVDSRVVGACLTGEWTERQLPIIAYLMTSADWKKHGVGRQLLNQSLTALTEKKHSEIRAVITEGNTPSEELFIKFGFRLVTLS